MPELAAAENSDFYFVEAADPDDGVRKVVTIVRERIPNRFGLDPVRDIQVLCPMNRGGLGARSLNVELQAALNPPGEIRIERFGWTFCLGDKVMQVENNYDKEVYDGDLGVVSRLDAEEGELSVIRRAPGRADPDMALPHRDRRHRSVRNRRLLRLEIRQKYPRPNEF